jgi:hypothetical protein
MGKLGQSLTADLDVSKDKSAENKAYFLEWNRVHYWPVAPASDDDG